MKRILIVGLALASCLSCRKAPEPPKAFGLSYSTEASSFKILATEADSVRIHFYEENLESPDTARYLLHKGTNEQWYQTINGDLQGAYYAFSVYRNGGWTKVVPDPYAKAVGTNGVRAQVVDLESTDPEGWSSDTPPALNSLRDAVIYELHVRDATIDSSAQAEHPGTFKGLAESPVVLPHIASLGVTHVHLLPIFDFYSVDETRLHEPQYNWGYDPLNYNAPEGSYSTDPTDGALRIRELKELVQEMHRQGLRVVMDVVYNHTRLTRDSYFEVLTPGVFYRKNEDGSFSDASACGNEVASEHPVVRQFMIESLKYWMNEYHIDGFRFDLMGIHDIETMNAIASELRGLRPDVLLYGEPWKAGSSPLPDEQLALKVNAREFPEVAIFSDDVRDGFKGSVFDEHDRGWVQGDAKGLSGVRLNFEGAQEYPNFISYVSCHDNHTLWDKLRISLPEESDSILRRRHRLALGGVLLSQGIPFLHAGTEFYRTKYGVENSYESPDSINRLNWSRLEMFPEGSEWVRRCISFRKEAGIGQFDYEEYVERLTWIEGTGSAVVGFDFNGAKEVTVLLNSGTAAVGYKRADGAVTVPGTGTLLIGGSGPRQSF